MDDIFEVLIYLFFIGASVIGGIYKNYAKKKEEEKKRRRMAESQTSNQEFVSEDTQEASVPRSLEDFLREQFEGEMEREEEVVFSPPVQEVIEPRAEEPKLETLNEGEAAFQITTDTLLSDNLNDSNFSITDLINAQEKNPIYENEISDSESADMGDLEEFDGAKAVIYSEILNRRHD